MGRSRPTIILVDDDEVAVMAFERAVVAQDVKARIKIARDGDEALALLREPGSVARPYVMLLDLNMPRMSGHDVLKELRNDPKLKDTIVFVISTSDTPEDIVNCYAQNVAGYIVKEDAYGAIRETVALMDHYTQLVRLPD